MSSVLQGIVNAMVEDMATYAKEVRESGNSEYLDNVIEVDPKDHSVLISYTTPNVALEFESPDTARIIATTYTGGAALAYLDRDDADTIYQYYFED